MLNEFRRLGLQTTTVPYTLPTDWRPHQLGNASYASNGQTINLTTIFPVSGTKGSPPARRHHGRLHLGGRGGRVRFRRAQRGGARPS